jgi:hypothetical protein
MNMLSVIAKHHHDGDEHTLHPQLLLPPGVPLGWVLGSRANINPYPERKAAS